MEFLLLENEFPRAVRYCVTRANRSLHAITGQPEGGFSCFSEQHLGRLQSELSYAQVESILTSGLHEYFDAQQTKMNKIDECVSADFFAHRPVAAGAGHGEMGNRYVTHIAHRASVVKGGRGRGATLSLLA